MIQSCDVGSVPYIGEPEKFAEGAENFMVNTEGKSTKLFERVIVEAFLDKLKAGIVVPAFPQFRDMSGMFLSTFEGLEKVRGGYIETGSLTLKPGHGKLPEVAAIERNAGKFYKQTGSSFRLRICITGPYTLASFFPYRDSQTYRQLGQVLSEIVKEDIFATRKGKTALVCVDEPLFGMIDDPLIDRGTDGREELLAAWESMMREARSRNVETCIHLHCTNDDLFWAVEALRIIESHVDDPLYEIKTTKKRLEKEDKLLKASIALTNFDRLIKEKLGSTASADAVADVWKNMSKKILSPETFLEDVGVMKKRLIQVIGQFGAERVRLAGPECGLRGFPTYASAIECLKRVSKAVNSFAK